MKRVAHKSRMRARTLPFHEYRNMGSHVAIIGYKTGGMDTHIFFPTFRDGYMRRSAYVRLPLDHTSISVK